MTWRIEQGHVLDVLRAMPAESVHCVVTSPPYWGLRAYGTEPQVWGGHPGCEHYWSEGQALGRHQPAVSGSTSLEGGFQAHREPLPPASQSHCLSCGAWRGELGSEPTIALFIAHLMQVFTEVRRVLRSDGTCWVNLGDSYAGSGKGPSKSLQSAASQIGNKTVPGRKNMTGAPREGAGLPGDDGLKPKDLCLIPERFALAMQDAGWWVRSRIAWCKTSAMPESVTDRPTSAWEHIWLFSKSARYFYDADAVREPQASADRSQFRTEDDPTTPSYGANGSHALRGDSRPPRLLNPAGGNQRNFWLLSPDNFTEAHFATFPREIPKRCILAGTSAKGCCPKCGAPWVRVTDVTRTHESGSGKAGHLPVGKNGQLQGNGVTGGDVRSGPTVHVTTIGWAPSCKCDAGEPDPCTVLDPFAGSGTTLFVAEEQGRDSIGIELNEKYVKLAEKRMRGARTPLPGLLS